MYVSVQLHHLRFTQSLLTLFHSIFVLLIGAFIPLWILPTGFGALAAGAFCIQFGVQGAWGVVSCSVLRGACRARLTLLRSCVVQIPIQLAEISPPAFRATFPGVAYQLGNVSGFARVLPSCGGLG